MAGENVINLAAMQGAAANNKRRARRRGGDGEVGAPPPAGDERSVIIVDPGERDRAVDDAETALIASGRPVYRQTGRLVRPVWETVIVSGGGAGQLLRINTLTSTSVLSEFERVATFQKYSNQADDYITCNCPDYVADAYLDRDGTWKLDYLFGVTQIPILHRDGSLFDTAGYDRGTGLLYNPAGTVYPDMPAEVTRDMAQVALESLLVPLRDFPFSNEAARSVALSVMITAVIRKTIPCAPLHVFTSTVAGSGKSKLADMASVMATGERASPVNMGSVHRDIDSELNKRLTGLILADDAIIAIDNIEGALTSDMLCTLLTQHRTSLRALGSSKMFNVPVNGLFIAGGNNMEIMGDLTRRSIRAMIDPGVERPELRVFDFDPVRYVLDNRPALVVAALTIIRAYIQAGAPMSGKAPGSYEEWSYMVREPLMWLGQADPWATTDEGRETDPLLQQLTVMLDEWEAVFGGAPVTIRAVCDTCQELEKMDVQNERGDLVRLDIKGKFMHRLLRDAVTNITGDHDPQPITATRLSWWLRKRAGRVVGGRKFQEIKDGKYSKWRITGDVAELKAPVVSPVPDDDDIPF